MDAASLLQRLVVIESVNPSLDAQGAGEASIAAFIADWAQSQGLSAEMIGTPERPSVLVRGGRGQTGRRLVFGAHLDTVGLAGSVDGITPRIEGDRLYARGAYDMKAGLAAALIACRDAAHAGIEGEVIVAAVADEEATSVGIQDALAIMNPGSIDGAIIAEPTERRIGTAHRGFVWTEFTITGVAAHGSRPQLGADAILATAPLLAALADLDARLRTRPHPFLGPGNLHASTISGGVEGSTIPDRCSLLVERRTLPGESLASIEDDITQLLDALPTADPRVTITAKTVLYRPPMETPGDAEILAALRAAVPDAELAPMSYWADSAFLSDAGIPTVLYGPEGEGAHADIEWVSLSGTQATAETFTRVAIAFCAAPTTGR